MAKSGPIGIGIVGIGRAGWGMHVGELLAQKRKFKIVAGCDVESDRADRLAKQFNARAYSKVEDLINDPEVELVDIASRSLDHYEMTRLALKANKHVFLEKPICANHAEAKRLKKMHEKSRGNLYIRHNRRFEPAFLHIREIIASGILGDIYEVKLARTSYLRRDDWQTLKSCGGGQLMNWGPHIIDHALRFLESPVDSMWSDLKRIAAAGDAEDHLKIVLKGANGRVVDLEISGGAAINAPQFLIWGTKGALQSDGAQLQLRYLNPRQKLKPRKASSGTPREGFGTPDNLKWIEKTIPVKPKKHYNIWDELHSAIRKGTRFPITLDEALEVMRIIDLARKKT